MTVKDKKSGKEISVNGSYGSRLIEQGKATLVRQRKSSAGTKAGKKKADHGTD